MQQLETTIERLGPVASATLRSAAVDAFEAFCAPGDVFRRPREVLSYPGLSRAEKRAILASWASDARAVDTCPALRCLPGCRAEPVPLDEVLAALQELDGEPANRALAGSPEQRFSERFECRWRGGGGTRESGLN
ncbi:hypothetical protein [Methylobacterium crusticola]|uniref:hypothetical protein n=1 Tax=Methylobacterium crusticola TaxID=1697972 RepID=UPI001FD0C24D|nr:hypothetical protein [Methylobacterium crusticola]